MLLLAGAAVAAYLNAFQGNFQFDDYNVIVGNPSVHSLSAWLADLRGLRPLLKLTYTLNWTSGLGLFGFHLFNVGLHAANGVMVYLLLSRFGGDSARESRPYETPAFFAALLFALHPVQTEAVTYISGRSMSLMAFFYLGSLLAYVRGRESGSGVWLYLISPVLFALGLLTKETAVTLPIALILWEAANRGDRRESARSIFRVQAVHWGILFAALFSLALHPGYAKFLSSNFGIRSIGKNLLTQVEGVSYLLFQLVWPVRLNIDPMFPDAFGWTWGLAGEALVLGSLLAVGIASLRRRPWVGFGILWLFLHLLPTNSIVPRLDVANERHLYVAGIGIFFAAAVQSWEWSIRIAVDRQIVRAGAAVLIIALGLLTVSRNHDYRSEIALWESSVRADPNNARAFNNLGHAYFLVGENERAGIAYREALRLDPGYDLARRNLAILE